MARVHHTANQGRVPSPKAGRRPPVRAESAARTPSSQRTPPDDFSAELDLTGWRGLMFTPEQARAAFHTPLMKHFLADLKSEAQRRGVAVHRVEEQLGRWRDGLEPSLKVEVSDGREGVLKLAATLGKNYNQDAVLVLSKGDNATVYSVRVPPGVSRAEVNRLLEGHDLPASSSSLDGRRLTLVAVGDHRHVDGFLRELPGARVTRRAREADFIERSQYAKVLGLEGLPIHPPRRFDLHFPVGALTKGATAA